MSYAIRLIGTVAGVPTEYDGRYVAIYNPAYWPEGEPYDGGLLATTENVRNAKHFPTAQAAMDSYRQSYGLRRDGEPNRPLTAWTVEIFQLTEEMLHGQPAAME